MYVDANGGPIDINNIYKDVKNDVNDIHIIKVDREYFAKPDELDEELLSDVWDGLVSMIMESEKGVLKNYGCIKV